MSEKKPAQIETFVCDDGHLHIEVRDEAGNLVTGLSMDIEAAIELVEDISEEIADYIGDDDEEYETVH